LPRQFCPAYIINTRGYDFREGHLPPAPPKGIKRKRAQARDLGFDRGRLYPLLPHGYALG
jgi:hypothetical protein